MNRSRTRLFHKINRPLIAALCLGLGVLLSGCEAPPPDRSSLARKMQSATLLPTPKPLTRFQLADHKGSVVTPESLTGRWQLLSFGYTHCPDICPTTLQFLKQLKQHLAREQVPLDYETLFVTVDAKRDTAPMLESYLASFDPEFRGVIGQPEALAGLTDQLGVMFQVADSAAGKSDYLVDHSATLILLDPQVRMQAIFSPPLDLPAIAHDLSLLMKSSASQ